MERKDFVLEIGTEELPPKVVGFSFAEEIKSNLINAIIGGIESEDIKLKLYITPRRIIIFIKNLPRNYNKIEEGPPKRIAYDKGGKPTKALMGFLKKIDATQNDIGKIPESDNEKIKVQKQVPVKELIKARLPKVFSAFSSYKNMHWDESGLLFPRPIRWILAMLGNEIIRCKIGNLSCGNITYGHHLFNSRPIKIKDTNDFFKKLRRRNVIYSFKERKQIISKYLTGKNWHRNEGLLNEVTGLVEYPDFIEGSFNKSYLKLPEEVLIASMSKNQRVFPLQDRNGKLANRFVGIIDGKLRQTKRIKAHYEQVLDAKLKDALFFYNEDLKKPLGERAEQLKGVIFHKKLGSYADKVERLKKLIYSFKQTFKLSDIDYEKIIKACTLCKADLLTQMVGEFPSLQGVMGKYYALAEDIDEEIARAIEEHHRPRFSEDRLPETKLGSILALLDKFDSVICHFKAGHQPKGNWDLYALRRQSIGIINIILAKKLELSLSGMFDKIFEIAPGDAECEKLKTEFTEFIKERLIVMMDEQYKFRRDLINAVISSGFDNIYNFYLRLDGLNNIINKFYFEQARCVVERTNNITKGVSSFIEEIDVSLLQMDEEKALFEKYKIIKDKFASFIQQDNYDEATKLYAEALSDITNSFFDKVMVNVDDKKLRNNRLKLLKGINVLYVRDIADLTKVVVRSYPQQ